MYDNDLWFATINLPYRQKLELLRIYKTSDEILYNFKNSELIQKYKFDIEKINYIKDEMKKSGMKIVFWNDDDYPKVLKNYDDMPYGLFYMGNIKKLNELNYNVAIVGSRRCTQYGKDITTIISREISINGIGIISGMARGIDTYAHKICLENNGYTCAVLGCGADVIYPKENKNLYCQIIRNGCIISQYKPNTKPLPYNFPIRNKIISGLSNLVLVTEADIKSGSIITASSALEQGKDVGAVPGSVFSKMSRGTNKLIQDGAHVIKDIDDVFGILNFQKINFKKIRNNSSYSSMPENQRQIYDLVSDKPIHVDDIKRCLNIDIQELYELLFEMQLKNKILCLSGSYYVRVNDCL
ncbi:DNA processing protein [Clostridium acetobutylicum]|uniref:DNA uptake protein n=1 Tax=Clostridium acetobutylicum (strain ATCC 824 / DSM 792 / JCM 1419 / IAM 19013 / LMG 5710 / NBRC 13948 / NRRL B-527 / VKM B-1787 / 2291 / W) TaxID=272562 RepID=Q97I69_CLOAB|nr:MULTISPECIES: DNA-processing protein DprA [Clostridium]AAK79749.1 DNA uptake protein [Clostridium acetobutylicum ATCC 824]ADZ20834.1 DNA uptake protein [Clostridium acetobutylicum EA 2018]AEI34286.1 DNA uptake protein [Clostridium acetobutylicum DSM 1731]AWV79816.1 DNA-protecting protein DprA [Clostridium acetobutylicum]MBC2394202.1 DNA-protecting protein DprA [Clostridium acetobutylicum]